MSAVCDYPLRFTPLLKRYLWGGRRLGTMFGKPIDEGDDYAESWEVSDHDAGQSVVAYGPLVGATLGEVLARHGASLMGRPLSYPTERFPLLMKLLDCNQTLSVQVHPNDEQAARLYPPDLGKTEAWVVLAAEPDSVIYAGLKPGIGRVELAAALEAGYCEECPHSFAPQPGDCVFIPAGTVHALGAGLVIAEIQQSSNTTYRLFDWNRVDADGNSRPLHIAQALDVIDYDRGPVAPQRPEPTDAFERERLVHCGKFVLDRVKIDGPRSLGGDGRFHIVMTIEGVVHLTGDPADAPLAVGQTALLPSAAGAVEVVPDEKATILDIYLP